MPHIDIVDMRIETARQRGLTSISGRLAEAMHERLAKREQTILFLNRRGYASSMQCHQCGHVENCPHCSIALTYHRTDEMLRCHLCGTERPAPNHCPKCGDPAIRWRGLGTQRVEEAVRRILPAPGSPGSTPTPWRARTASGRSWGSFASAASISWWVRR